MKVLPRHRLSWLAAAALSLVSAGSASAQVNNAQTGLDHLAESAKWIAAAIVCAGVAIALGIYRGLQSLPPK